MDETLEKLRDNFVHSVLFATEEDIVEVLPNLFNSNFDILMTSIITALEKEISDNEYIMSNEKDENHVREYEKEIASLKRKLFICKQKIEEVVYERKGIEQENDFDNSQKMNIIFGINPAGNISFFNDVKRKIDPHRYEDVSKLLEEMKEGKLDKNNSEKGKKMSHNSKLSGVEEKKGYQLRIFYKTLPNHMIYITMIRHKKDNNESLDSAEPIARFSLLGSDYERVKRNIKQGKIEEYLTINEQVYEEIQSFLKDYAFGGKRI